MTETYQNTDYPVFQADEAFHACWRNVTDEQNTEELVAALERHRRGQDHQLQELRDARIEHDINDPMGALHIARKQFAVDYTAAVIKHSMQMLNARRSQSERASAARNLARQLEGSLRNLNTAARAQILYPAHDNDVARLDSIRASLENLIANVRENAVQLDYCAKHGGAPDYLKGSR